MDALQPLSGHSALGHQIAAASNLQSQLPRTQSNVDEFMDDETIYDGGAT